MAGVSPSRSKPSASKWTDWSHCILEELRDLLYVLTQDGRIIYISPNTSQLTGYSTNDLTGKFIVDFLHPDDSRTFVREFNESISIGHALHIFHRFRKKDNTYTIFESRGHPHRTLDTSPYGSSDIAESCRGVFMMARPYPTKNGGLLDTFLEHTTDKYRLAHCIMLLREEEEVADAELVQDYCQKKQEVRSSIAPSGL